MDDYGSSPSSLSSSDCEKYDVFLSFRGEDTRNNFTSHLYAALKRKQIETYIDEKSLERGDEIQLALPEAIQKSRIAIVVFSKDYASSSWCLRELTHILERRQEKKQMVIPIFYEVDPSDIRKQEGSYKTSFIKHEDRFKDDMEMVNKWKAALVESADLSGWDSRVTRPESELVEAIAEDVLRKLNRVPSSAIGFKDLIGIEENIQKIERLLSLGSPDIRIVGIWGLGGLGKTTIADVVFNKHFYQFESYCFLANVREESGKLGLINLRDKLLGELLKEKEMNLGTPSLPPQVKDRLCRKRVLIVLDDVNTSEQLQVLVGDRELFRHGSRIIITTRDARVLKDIEADGIYEVRQLNKNEAIQLFKMKAFRGNSPTPDYIKLSEKVVEYTGGIPLAVNILASHLRSLYPKSIGDWETVLSCLKEVSHDDIDKKLRISYDGLNKKEQAIFLDIACFFKGESREKVENILNGCGFSASVLLNNLIDKSLITISSYFNKLGMHDLIQEMGWKVVQQESEERLEQQSRLWIAKDAYWLLKNGEGTKKIEGIFLDMAKIDKKLQLDPKVFQKMNKLRILKIYNTVDVDFFNNVKRNRVCFRKDLQSLPHSLRYLHWEGYPSKLLPPDFEPQNLVEINMPYSELEQFSNEDQDFENLKSVDLSHCIHLTQFPNFSRSAKLEEIIFEGSSSLLHVSLHGAQKLDKLTYLNLRHCNKIETLPIILTRNLVSLDLSSTAIDYLPSSIGSLINLSELSLNDCTRLANLPSSINELGSLIDLELRGCLILDKFPELPRNIKWLDISGTAIKKVTSSSIEGRFDLQYIDLSDCKSLQTLPTSIFKMRSLRSLSLDGCSNLKNLPEIPEPMESLKVLCLNRTGIRELPASIGHLIGIKELFVEKCEDLEFVPITICNISSRFSLNLSSCPKLRFFPISVGFQHWGVNTLILSNSNMIEISASFQELSSLKKLYVNNCKNLRSLPELPLGLQFLDAQGCESLEGVFNSKSPLAVEFWEYNDDVLWSMEYLLFADCLKLDKKVRDNIIIEFQHRVLRIAALLATEEHLSVSYEVGACFPENEIPKWFEYQAEGSSINIKFPPQRHNSNFLGLVLCIVGFSYCDIEKLDLTCIINLKLNHGKNYIFYWDFCNHRDWKLSTTSNSSNLYMWYVRDLSCEFLGSGEASLDFSIKKVIYDETLETSKLFEVKKCGIHVLHVADLEELKFDFPIIDIYLRLRMRNINLRNQMQLPNSLIPVHLQLSTLRQKNHTPRESNFTNPVTADNFISSKNA